MADLLKRASPPRNSKQDDSIMGTNNSSIVSKRSVERLYYPDELHFFRYFVKKPQRRAPLINRGYWLRMKAIEHIVRKFLDEPSERPKVVMNLGCGYDPNPWQCLYRYPKACENVTFIDVDYMPLMEKKRDVVRSTTALNAMLVNVTYPESGKLLLRSNQYLQIGCDLRQLSELSDVLASVLDVETSLILCTAEVSITYMNVEESDALIRWVSELPHARFCVLEQILPEGPEHPFAKTMLAHFEKLNTPIKAVIKYPRLEDQELRFRNNGWSCVSGTDLWSLWCCQDFLTSSERMALDKFEPFDEWEEFILFACHYFLLTSSNGDIHSGLNFFTLQHSQPETFRSDNMLAEMTYAENQNAHGFRRFGAPLPIRGHREYEFIGNFGGMGLKTRVSSYDIYVPSSVSVPQYSHNKVPVLKVPSPRMCHTITDLGDAGALLVGGRTSPDGGLVDCWLYHKWTDMWERIDDLPGPRYRHSAVALKSGSVLIVGGKSDSRTVLKDMYLWSRRSGWVECSQEFGADDMADSERMDQTALEHAQPAIFGANLGVIEMSSSTTQKVIGTLIGGMTQDGLISDDLWIWTLQMDEEREPSISLERIEANNCAARFGATILSRSGQLLLIGGLARNGIVTPDKEIIVLDHMKNEERLKTILVKKVNIEHLFPRPLLIGSSISFSGDLIVATGGGAVCFSFGTFWNRGCFTLNLLITPRNAPSQTISMQDPMSKSWTYLDTIELGSPRRSSNNLGASSTPADGNNFELSTIRRMKLSTEEDFDMLVSLAKPTILEDLELGSCTKVWTGAYLIDRIGVHKKVVVHQASAEHMDFLSKNFQYVAMPFGDFMQAIDGGKRLYLRSLSADRQSELPANLDRDFPMISKDFRLPPELKFVTENVHSSALRISGPVQMWLHYDVMANVLCQIQGHKRLLLFPPSDIQHFEISPGASSSSIDGFSKAQNIGLAPTHPHEAILCPGDVLFIPPLWLHTASPTDGRSVAVNVFFRDLASGYAAGKDVYGNRDLQAYEKGRQDIAKIAKSFGSLPRDTRMFYVWRLAEELKSMVGL